ncbi:RhoGAP domain-containing protein [Aphelenchoides besseyi]|nr:RhoGAP domain-containing protein [Aphelenchoides besseyi]
MTIDCAYCRKGMRFGTMCCECKNCKLMFHETCKDHTTITCLPRRGNSIFGAPSRLGDFCPDSHPMVLYLVGHCVIQLEKTAVTSSVYLDEGDEEMIDKLLKTFKSTKTIPELSDCPPEVVAGCVKKFLNDIRDPLIPLTYREEFCAATKFDDSSKLIECIKNLPTCHLHTLVALCIHWQRLVECNKPVLRSMNYWILSETLGPIVYGSKRCGSKIQEDLESQLMGSLQKILKIPSDQLRELCELQLHADVGNAGEPNTIQSFNSDNQK